MVRFFKAFFTYFLFWVIPVSAQSTQEIDSLIRECRNLYRNTFEHESNVSRAFKVVELSKAIHYERGIVEGLFFIADIMRKSGEYEKSLEYVKEVRSYQNYLSAHPYDEFYIIMLQIENYRYLGLQSLAKNSFQQAKSVIMREKDSAKRNLGLFTLYSGIGIVSDEPDTLYYYYNKAKIIVNEPNFGSKEETESERELNNKEDKALLSANLGDYYLNAANTDSAGFYYHEALELLRDAGSPNTKIYAYKGLGNLHEQLKNYSLAIEYHQKSIDIANKYHKKEGILKAYEAIARLYSLSHNIGKEKEYQKLYAVLADSLKKERDRGGDKAVIILVEENEKKLEYAQARNRMVMAGIGVLIAIVFVALYFLFIKYKRIRRNDALLREEALLKENNQILSEKVEETEHLNQEIQSLQQKVNESFIELVDMAKSGDPYFYSRFDEVYPDFHKNLLKVCPSLQAKELQLCAYIYLGFSSKEIAAYTFKSSRTIDNQRITLRKRFKLPPSESLYAKIRSM